MGRTHKLTSTTKSSYVPHVKGINPTGGWRGPSTRASVHVEMEQDEEELDYQKIVPIFYNYYFDKEFNSDIYHELVSYYDPNSDDEYGNGSDTHIQNIISIIMDYMECVVKETKNKKWIIHGLGFNEIINLTNFDMEHFEIALESYFENFREEDHYMWWEHYSPNSEESKE